MAGKKRREMVFLPSSQEHKDRGRKCFQGSRALEKGGSCFVQVEGTRKTLRFPMEEWRVPDIAMAVKLEP